MSWHLAADMKSVKTGEEGGSGYHKRVPIDTSIWISHFEQHLQLAAAAGPGL